MKTLIMAAAFTLATAGVMANDSHAAHDHSSDHAKAVDDHGHGERQDLGTTTVAGVKLQVCQFGKAEGQEGVFEVAIAKGAPMPKAVRVWVGVESAEGSVKARAEGDGPAYDMHVELPNPMPDNSQFWVEVQPAEGKREKVAFNIKK